MGKLNQLHILGEVRALFQQRLALRRGKGPFRLHGSISHLTAQSGLQAFTRPQPRVGTIAEEPSQPRFFMSTTGEKSMTINN